MLETFTAASHNEVLQLVIQIAVLLLVARLLGGLFNRLGQPSVIGEILAGVVLGPSLLAGLVPQIGRWIYPQTPVQGNLLEVISLLGVMFLLVVTGLETDLDLIRRKSRTALGVAVGSLVIPFVASLALAYALPIDLVGAPEQRTVFALFFATALSISAIPVLAKVLMDLDLMRRDIGQTLLASGMIADITGWTLLGLVTALASAEALTGGIVVRTLGVVLVFLLSTVTVGQWLVNRGLVFVQDRFRGPDHMLTLVVVLAFAWGAFTQALHLEPVLGAFAIGILFGRSTRLQPDTVHKLEGIALGIFAPIFFAVSGLKVDVSAIIEPRLLAVTAAVVAVATASKVVGAYLGARYLAKQDMWSSLAYGAGLNARGALEIIVASIGLSLGILTQEMFSIIVVMAVATSIMTPIALRFTIRRVELDEEEATRLLKERALEGSFVGSIRRVLVPVRPGIDSPGYTREMQATLLRQLGELQDMSITLMAVTTAEQRSITQRQLGQLKEIFEGEDVSTRAVVSDDPVSAILREAESDYDLMVLGTPTARATRQSLFSDVIDDLVKLAPCPTMLVRGVANDEDWRPRRILVPVNGTAASRRAAELAFAMADEDVEMTAIHIVTPSPGVPRGDLAIEVTAEMEKVGLALGKVAATHIRRADDPESGIMAAIEEFQPDLLVLGTSVRAGTSRLHLGPRVEFLVRHAPCPVAVVNS
ncbi:MAG TPA: cation:proton antiporter [Acidimicrobiia bacterium]|jgi:Kef-type K+ transport system membrane component KefB